jgi:hypothetical protein
MRTKPIVVAGLLVGVSVCQSLANETTDRIVALSADKRNEFWTLYLQQSSRKCEAAVRSMFQGESDDGLDSWSVACTDGESYSVGIAAGPEGATTLMSCDELVATEAVLLKLSGSKLGAVGCWEQRSQ